MDYLTRYYKNLSEQLEAKYRRLLNEVESPFQVDSPLSADGPGADPNTRNIASVETAGDSVRLQLPPFDPNNKVWRQSWQGYNNPNNPPWNNWASFLNGLYQNWNNNQWWFDSQLADLVYVIYGDDYNWQNLPNGTFQLTEQMKLIAWNCLQNMMIAGSQATSLQNSRGAASTVLTNYQRQVGNYSGVQDYYSNFSINVANYWFGGQGQQLTQFPPTQPWNSPPGYLPFPGAPVFG